MFQGALNSVTANPTIAAAGGALLAAATGGASLAVFADEETRTKAADAAPIVGAAVGSIIPGVGTAAGAAAGGALKLANDVVKAPAKAAAQQAKIDALLAPPGELPADGAALTPEGLNLWPIVLGGSALVAGFIVLAVVE